jgi:hypothetical protein
MARRNTELTTNACRLGNKAANSRCVPKALPSGTGRCVRCDSSLTYQSSLDKQMPSGRDMGECSIA